MKISNVAEEYVRILNFRLPTKFSKYFILKIRSCLAPFLLLMRYVEVQQPLKLMLGIKSGETRE